MVPELGRFFADYLKPEAEGFAVQTAAFYPDVFLAYGTPRHCFEWWHNYPEDSRQAFLVNAWILGKDCSWLAKHLDVPWARLGDLYYLEKVAETVKSHRGVTWQPSIEDK